MAKTLAEVIAALPVDERAKVEARAAALIKKGRGRSSSRKPRRRGKERRVS